jgi:hypothetical protein
MDGAVVALRHRTPKSRHQHTDNTSVLASQFGNGATAAATGPASAYNGPQMALAPYYDDAVAVSLALARLTGGLTWALWALPALASAGAAVLCVAVSTTDQHHGGACRMILARRLSWILPRLSAAS